MYRLSSKIHCLQKNEETRSEASCHSANAANRSCMFCDSSRSAGHGTFGPLGPPGQQVLVPLVLWFLQVSRSNCILRPICFHGLGEGTSVRRRA